MSLNPQLYPPIPPVGDGSSRPFWSVIVPAYKPEFLPQALRSVMEQDPGPELMEILVLDDCSPHQLEPLVRKVCGDRAQYTRHIQNLGTYSTENAGIIASRGIWIHILNDDDWVLPGFYSTFYDALKDQPPKIGVACCRQMNVDESGRDIVPQAALRDGAGVIENWIDKVGVSNPVHPVGTIIRRSTFEHLGGYFPNMNCCADWEFNKRSAVFYDWWYEPRIMACYRHHGRSVSEEGRVNGELIRDIGRCITMSESYLPPEKRRQITEKSREAYALNMVRVAGRSLARGDVTLAIRELQSGLELCRSPKMLEQLAILMAQPFAAPLRELLPQFFKMISIRPGNESTDKRE